MRKRLRIGMLSVLVMLLLSIASVPVKASYDCSAGCTSFQQWNGTTYGGFSNFTVDDPGFYDSSAFYLKFLRLSDSFDSAHTDIGVVKVHGSGTGAYCSQYAHDTAYYFIYSWNASLQNLVTYCSVVPGNNKNVEQVFSILYSPSCVLDGSLNDEMFVSIAGVGQCIDNEHAFYDREILQAEIKDHVSGNQVWGGLWNLNSWANSAQTFVYQNRMPDSSAVQGAMRMYWSLKPQNSSTGGVLRSCVYEVFTGVCTYNH